MQFWHYEGVNDERYGLEGFRLSDDERSTGFMLVLRSETIKYRHVCKIHEAFSKLIQCPKTKTQGDIPDKAGG